MITVVYLFSSVQCHIKIPQLRTVIKLEVAEVPDAVSDASHIYALQELRQITSSLKIFVVFSLSAFETLLLALLVQFESVDTFGFALRLNLWGMCAS